VNIKKNLSDVTSQDVGAFDASSSPSLSPTVYQKSLHFAGFSYRCKAPIHQLMFLSSAISNEGTIFSSTSFDQKKSSEPKKHIQFPLACDKALFQA